MKDIARPIYGTDAMLEYLDGLRASGVVNMLGAGAYLDEQFPELLDGERPRSYKSSSKAREVLNYWMETFGEASR